MGDLNLGRCDVEMRVSAMASPDHPPGKLLCVKPWTAFRELDCTLSQNMLLPLLFLEIPSLITLP